MKIAALFLFQLIFLISTSYPTQARDNKYTPFASSDLLPYAQQLEIPIDYPEPDNCDISIDANNNQSIQDTVNSATKGQVICVKPGIYNQSVNINTEGITLWGDLSNPPILDGKYSKPAGGEQDHHNYKPLIGVYADSITVGGFKLIRSRGTGIAIGKSKENDNDKQIKNTQLIGNITFANRTQGIMLRYTDQTKAYGNLVEFNHSKNLVDENFVGGSGFGLRDSTNTTINNNIIRYNTAEGILIDENSGYSHHSTINKNIMHDNGHADMYIHGTSDLVFEENLIFRSYLNPFFSDPNGTSSCVSTLAAEYDIIKQIKDEDGKSVTDFSNFKFVNNLLWACSSGFKIATQAQGITLQNINISHNTFVSLGDGPAKNNNDYRGIIINNHTYYTNKKPKEAYSIELITSKILDSSIHNNIFSTYSNFPYTPIQRSGKKDFIQTSFSGNIWSKKLNENHPNDQDNIEVELMGQDGNGKFEHLKSMPSGGYEEIKTWFKLHPDSPAINASVDSIESLDHWQSKRDDKPDVGAHEFGGTLEPTNTPKTTQPTNSWDLNHDSTVNTLDFSGFILGFSFSEFDFLDLFSYTSSL